MPTALDLVQRTLPRIPRRSAQYQMTPEEEQSLIGRVGSGALGGISMLGNFLDVPGSMARDVLAGQNPIDQLGSIFRSENRTTGRDLLRKYGLAGRKDTWGNFGAGIGAEIALDPLTYLTFGASALSKSGRVAKAAGLLDDVSKVATQRAGQAVGKRVGRMTTELDDLLAARPGARVAAEQAAGKLGTSLAELQGQKLGGNFGLNVPFTGIGGAVNVPGGQKLAQGMDVLGAGLKQTAPVRAMRGLFDRRVMNTFDAKSQELAENMSKGRDQAGFAARTAAQAGEDVLQAGFKSTGDTLHNAVEMSDDVLEEFAEKGSDPHYALFDDMVRHTAERGPDEAMDLFMGGRDDALRETLQSTADSLVTVKNQALTDLQALGVDITELMPEGEFGVEHFPRYVDRKTAEEMAKESIRIAPGRTAVNMARTKETRDVPREIVNRMLADKNARVGNFDEAGKHILENYTKYLNPKYEIPKEGYKVDQLKKWFDRNKGMPWFRPLAKKTAGNVFDEASAAKGLAIENHARDLARWVQRHGKKPLYKAGRTGEDFGKYMHHAEKLKQSAESIHEFFGTHAVENGPGISLDEAFKAAGFNGRTGMQRFLKDRGITLDLTTEAGVNDAAKFKVPREIAKAASNVMEPFREPDEYAGVIGKIFDTVNNATRGLLTLPFASFHFRNLGSGQMVNVSSGHMRTPGDLASYLAEVGKTHKIINDAGNPLHREMTQAGVFQGERAARFHGRGFQDVSPSDLDPLSALLQQYKVTAPVGKGLEKGMAAGGWVMNRVEEYNRVPMYMYLRKKGFTPVQAAKEVEKLHFDYSRLTKFEKNFMRRGTLFYTFTRRMAPLLFDMISERPGGFMAQTIKATARQRGQIDQPIPEYLEETTAIPLGNTSQGDLRFFSGLGLPQEDVLSFGSSPLSEGLSRTSPLIKAPLELAFGESLFQRGRPLGDLDPSMGRLADNLRVLAGGKKKEGRAKPLFGSQGLEFLAANSPLSRGIQTARTLTDIRKWEPIPGTPIPAVIPNLLSGMRVTDVSPAVQDAVLRERAQDMMKKLGGRSFEKVYIPADELAAMPPQKQLEAMRFNALMSELARRAKERKLGR